ncbi:hypothetical protein [uncultured Variovorax sp.]|uniref:hypothetical protein n=1 Tax=uncultured Variovorax sp. TaxID=114708 RepID=UPI00260B8694|nr:hypothetical protein [uncultured Variovorax sp.]
MDLPTLKLLAARVRSLLEQSHHRIGHNQALDLIAALPGLRNWPEVKAFPDRVMACQLDEVSAARLGASLKTRFGLDMNPHSLLSSLSPPAPNPPFLAVLDELAFNSGVPDDRLREALRDVDGVPKTSYVVRDGSVFVFDKLLQEVQKAQAGAGPGHHLSELAAQLLPMSMVSPAEAVEHWGLVPPPYERLAWVSGEFTIWHRPFNARIPGTFMNEHDVQRALARLIVGDVQPGRGDFTYRGQPLILCDPLDLALLPPRPTLPPADGPTRHRTAALAHVAYLPGFDPISEPLFAEVKQLEADWGQESARCAGHVRVRIAELWSRVEEFQSSLASLNQLRGAGTVPEYALEEFAELRPLYSELTMLSDGALFAMFDSFQMECRYINGWTASRDDDFLFYLLGKVAGSNGEFEGEKAEAVGEWIAAAVLGGSSFDSALAFGLACESYDSAVARLAKRIADAMTFLGSDKDVNALQGCEIRTLREHFQRARSYGSSPIVVEQDLSDLLATDVPRF